MTTRPGEITIDSFSYGDMDLTSGIVRIMGFNIYEDMLDPYGPKGEVRVADEQDALGKYNIKGEGDVSINFSTGYGGSASFKMKPMQNANLNDTSQDSSAGNMKFYDLRFCAPELINAQQGFCEKSYKKQVTSIIEDVYKQNLKTQKSINIKSPSEGELRHVLSRVHPSQALEDLQNRYVSQNDKSSLLAIYHTRDGGSEVIKVQTFEDAFKGSGNMTFRQSTTLATGTGDPNSIMSNMLWFKPSSMFYTPIRGLSGANETTYNTETGKAVRVTKNPQSSFTVAGQTLFQPNTSSQPDNRPPVYTRHSPSNDKGNHGIGEARANRSAYLAHLAQNSAEMEIMGNPNITVGSMINLELSDRSGFESGDDRQFNGKALVVGIRHKVKPIGQDPRYTMILRVVKAGFEG